VGLDLVPRRDGYPDRAGTLLESQVTESIGEG
jgi:hypothetical protein